MFYIGSNADQTKGILALLLAMKLSGRMAVFYGNDNAGCFVTSVHFNG